MAAVDLVPSISIANVVQKRDAAVERAAQICRALEEMKELGFPTSLRYAMGNQDYFDLEVAKKQIDAATWQALLSDSGLYTFFDAKAREEWRKAIDKCDVPEVTTANVEATFATLYQSRGEMFERGVLDLFRTLSWDYKSNNPCLFDKKIVLTYAVHTAGGWQYASVEHGASNKLDDLTRVFSLLDGKPEPDHRHGAWRALHGAQWPRQQDTHEFEYFTIRGYKNGNIHLTFKRRDLVAQMNKIVAKHYPSALSRHVA
jgi:hypothetical protein